MFAGILLKWQSKATAKSIKNVFNNFCLLFDEFMCHFAKRVQLIKRTIKYAAIYDLLQSLDLFATLFPLSFLCDKNFSSVFPSR